MRHLLTLSVVLAALATAAAGATPPVRTTPPKGRAAVITKPDWAALPSADDIARFYPEHAARNAISGRAVIACSVTAEGRLVDCGVVTESPEGEDFGAAALRMSPYFQMKPQTLDGTPVEGAQVRIPIVFTAPDPGEAPSMMGQPPGPPPPLPPTTGRFVFAGVGEQNGQGAASSPILFYLRIPDEPLTGDTLHVWMAVAFPPAEDGEMYWMLSHDFDCAGRRFRPQGAQVFVAPDTRVSWAGAAGAGWQPADPEPLMAQALDLACGKTQPAPSVVLGSITEVRADAKTRFAAAGVAK